MRLILFVCLFLSSATFADQVDILKVKGYDMDPLQEARLYKVNDVQGNFVFQYYQLDYAFKASYDSPVLSGTIKLPINYVNASFGDILILDSFSLTEEVIEKGPGIDPCFAPIGYDVSVLTKKGLTKVMTNKCHGEDPIVNLKRNTNVSYIRQNIKEAIATIIGMAISDSLK